MVGLRWRRKHSVSGLALAGLIVLVCLLASSKAMSRQPIEIQFLSVSDWHAQLDPLSIPDLGNVGGAAVLSAYWQAERATNPNTLTLTAGDAFGASPPLSSFFDEEPAILAMNLMRFDVDTFGNHNFDRGVAHLQRVINLAGFRYVSANLKNVEGVLSGVTPFVIFDMSGVKVAVIGITNPEAPSLVKLGNFGAIEVTDPVRAAMDARAAAQRAGAQVFVAIAHLGVTRFASETSAPVGPLIDFANSVHGFDVILGDHTDVQFSGIVNQALVVENRSKGLTYARTKLTVDPWNGRVIDRSVEFVTPLSDAVKPDPAVIELLVPYRRLLSAAFDEPIGIASAEFPRRENAERLQEVALGDLIADAIRLRYGTELGFTNGGGIRDALPSGYAPANRALRRPAAGYDPGPPYDLVVGDIYAVLPFGNSVVTREVTGAQLYAILEHSVAALPDASGRFGQISGFRFVYDSSRPAGARVLSVTREDGTAILPDGVSYTFATNDFVNSGGDGYVMLADGEGVTREPMADVVVEYIRSRGTVLPTIGSRITDLSSR